MANKKPVKKTDGEADMYGKGFNEPKAKTAKVSKTKASAKAAPKAAKKAAKRGK